MIDYRTHQRNQLRGLFEKNPHRYFTARELVDRIGSSISLSAVYRNLSAMESAGLIGVRVFPGDPTRHYRLAAHPECSHHVHFSCTKCGRLTHLSDSQTKEIRRMLAASGFQLDLGKTVLNGLCTACGGSR